jgi:long-chain acyl-CoA synthetase
VSVVDAIREQAARAPGAPALLVARPEAPGEADAVGYADLVARMDAVAERLRDAGLREGERCGLVARQGPGFVAGALGILAAGGCMVPIPDDGSEEANAELARRARLHWIAREADGFAASPGPAPGPVDGAGDERFRALRPAYLRFTSGTTAERKGVILGHDAILARLAAANRGLAIGPGDRVLWLLPMAHHFVVSILLYLRYGATVLLPAGHLARPVLELASRAQATLLYASPHHYLLLGKDVSELALPRVRLAISTAEGLRAEIAERFRARFGVPLAQALGIIEVGLPVVNLARAAAKPECLGQPLPDYDVWLRGEDGLPVAGVGSPERTGEVCIRGPGLFDAYLDPWIPARELTEPDGFRTGDQGWFDADGDLHLAGRRRNRINMAGMKFFSEEVEAVLDAMPGVRRSRVLARDHPHLGEIPVAELEVDDRAAPPARGALVAWCRRRLPGYKIPREFRIVAALPETHTGKLARTEPVG